MNKRNLILFGLLFIFAGTSFAATAKTGWWILRRPQSTKPQALTAVVSIRGDLSGVFYNPSILGSIKRREVFFMTELGLASDTFGGILYGQPLSIGKGAGFSGGVVYYDAGKTTLNWIDAGILREANVTVQKDMLALLSYGQTINNSILAGATLKLASSNIAEVSQSSAYCLDLGALYFFPGMEGLALSVAIQNIGSSTKFLNRADSLPMSILAGCSYGWQLKSGSYLGLAVDVPYIVEESRTVPGIGVDYSFGKISFNLGYKLGVEDSALSLGFSIINEKYDIGYSISPSQYLSYAHRISIGYRF